MEETSSSRLLRRYLAGSKSAAFDLYMRYQNRLIGLASKQLLDAVKSKVDAEDISQETFQVFFELANRHEIRWQKRGDLWHLLAGIAINKVKQKLSHYSVEKRSLFKETQISLNGADIDLADQDAVATELAELVEHILISEKPLTKSIVELRLAGFNQKQIAEKTGRSTRTIRRLLESLQAKLISENEFGIAGFFQTSSATADKSLDQVTQASYKDFHLLRMIGQGSFSKVYLAKQICTGSLFAVKAIKKKWLSDSVAHHTFQREAQLLMQLKHPNIVTCFGVGSLPNGGSFLLLEYVEGLLLEEAIQMGSVAQLTAWSNQLTDAVQTIHANKVIHGDLCLRNVMVDLNNQIRILDFGLGGLVSDKSIRDPTSDLKGLNSIKRLLIAELKKAALRQQP